MKGQVPKASTLSDGAPVLQLGRHPTPPFCYPPAHLGPVG